MEYEKVCPDSWDMDFVFASHNFTTRGCWPDMSCIEVPRLKNDQLSCPPMTNGLGFCFEQTAAGKVALMKCPGSDTEYAYHSCFQNGTWEQFSTDNIKACLGDDTGDISDPPEIQQLYTIAYVGRSISLVSLLFTLFFFVLIRNNHRKHFNKVHCNLLVSLTFNCILVLFLKRFFTPEAMQENAIWCTALHVTYSYSYECTVFWMLVEGVYLNVYMMNFHTRYTLKIYIVLLILGWGIPFLLTLGWFLAKISHSHHDCLNYDMMAIDLILKFPTFASLMINLLLYVNIIRLVCVQSNFLNSEVPPDGRRSIIKLMVTLLPLLGITYLFEIPMYVEKDLNIKLKWILTNYIFQSFQGLFVSVVFWLTLNDLRDALRGAFAGRQVRYKQPIHQEMTEVVTNLVPVTSNSCATTGKRNDADIAADSGSFGR